MKRKHYESLNDLRKNERGAALITSLLVSTLLLVVGGALIMTTNLAQGLAIDSTSELQAYYSAEAGVNQALNVLRGNIASNPAGTNATFRNAADDADLSTWLTYDATISAVSVVQTNATPQMGYTVNLTDPDGTAAGLQPTRLLIQSTGYGPKGSKKQMELMVSRYLFDFSPIAAILMRGNDDGLTPLGTFNIGNSNAKEYTGYDQADPTKSLPVFGVTHGTDYTGVSTEIASAKPSTVSGVDKVMQFENGQLPSFLQSADNARTFLNNLQAAANGSGRYFTSSTSDLGTDSNPKFTFIDGDASLSDGAGLLVVTGTLSASGNVGFKGIILVLGEGVFQRNGGGNGDTLGAIVVAAFARTWPSEENAQSHPFLSPTYDMNGGGNSITGYDSNQVDRALGANGLRSLGIREY